MQPVPQKRPVPERHGERRGSILLIPAADFQRVTHLPDPFQNLFRAGGFRVVLVECLYGPYKKLAAPLDFEIQPVAQELFLHKTPVPQSALDLRTGKEGFRFRVRPGQVRRNAASFQPQDCLPEALVIPVQLQEIHVRFPHVRKPFQGVFPQSAIEQLVPAHNGGFQAQTGP